MAPTPERRTGPSSEEAEPRAALRNLTAYAAVLVGAALLALGWWGISGTAVVARQLPYLASGSIPGAALVVAGALLVAGDRSRRADERAADMVGTLYRLLTEAVGTEEAATPSASGTPEPADARVAAARWVTVPGSARFHRSDCALVRGKDDVAAVDAAAITSDDLQPCPICDPPTPGAADRDDAATD